MVLRSQSSQVAAHRRQITQSPVSFSSSSFIFNGSQLLGISVLGVLVFVRHADSYQESGQKSPWEKSNFPEIWQVQTFHTECTPSQEASWPLTSRHARFWWKPGFVHEASPLKELTFLTLCMEGLRLACHCHWVLDMDTSMVLVWAKEKHNRWPVSWCPQNSLHTGHFGWEALRPWLYYWPTGLPWASAWTDFFHCQHEGLLPALYSFSRG